MRLSTTNHRFTSKPGPRSQPEEGSRHTGHGGKFSHDAGPTSFQAQIRRTARARKRPPPFGVGAASIARTRVLFSDCGPSPQMQNDETNLGSNNNISINHLEAHSRPRLSPSLQPRSAASLAARHRKTKITKRTHFMSSLWLVSSRSSTERSKNFCTVLLTARRNISKLHQRRSSHARNDCHTG